MRNKSKRDRPVQSGPGVVSFYMTERKILRELQRLADSQNISRSELLSRLVADFMITNGLLTEDGVLVRLPSKQLKAIDVPPGVVESLDSED